MLQYGRNIEIINSSAPIISSALGSK